MNVISAHHQVVHLCISKPNHDDWILSATYSSPHAIDRGYMWDNFSRVADNTNMAWMAIGDFNNFSSTNERRSFARDPGNANHRRAMKFAHNLARYGLEDLGSSGPTMTWSNGRPGLANTLVRLDRAVANYEWRQMFPEATLRVLPRIYSDHSPILMLMNGLCPPPTPFLRPFRMQDMWLDHRDFHELVAFVWNSCDNSLCFANSAFASHAKTWNTNIFGNIFQDKKRLLARIEGIQKAQSFRYSQNLFLLEK